jgi:hypothetical protein
MKIKILVFTAISFICFSGKTTYAQAPDWLWAKSIGGEGNNDAGFTHAAVDASGNTYVAGNYSSKTLTLDQTTFTNAGESDIFLVKYDTYGKVLWAKNAGGKYFDQVASITVDASGNFYITGFFRSSSITFGDYTLTSQGGWDWVIFLVKYDTNGNVIWAKNPKGSKIEFVDAIGKVGLNYATFITADKYGNIYLAGSYKNDTLIFDSIVLLNDEISDSFLAKYDENGNTLWVKNWGGKCYNNIANSIAVDDSGNFYLTGSFNGISLSFDSISLNNILMNDIFLVKFDKNGNALWAKSAGGKVNDQSSSVAVDASCNVYIAGNFASKELTFGPYTIKSGGLYSDIFLVKYDGNGNVLWAKSEGGKNDEQVGSIVVDAAENLYITGSFNSSPFALGSSTLKSEGLYDVFLAKYGKGGNPIWAKGTGGLNIDGATSVGLDASGNIYFTGRFGSPTIKFGSTILTSSYGNSRQNSSWNFFLAKLKN